MNEVNISTICINENDGVIKSTLFYGCNIYKDEMIFNTLTTEIKFILDGFL